MTFLAHAAAHGLIINDLIPDGRWHRVPTKDKPRKKNGVYLWNGQTGVVKNWATMGGFSRYPQAGEKVARIDFDALRKAQERADREEAQKHARTAQEAAEAILATEVAEHPYLKAKGFPDAKGLVKDGALLIPMRDYKTKQVISLQTIQPDGAKKFLYGGRTKGAVFVIGNKYGAERWLVEGYATGLSVQQALAAMYRNAEVWVCFSASNLAYVAERIGGVRYVVADNDESRAGQEAAESTGLPWVMSPVVGEDANDFAQREGLWALVRLLRGVDNQKK
jgi:putative DNA primase/helicase